MKRSISYFSIDSLVHKITQNPHKLWWIQFFRWICQNWIPNGTIARVIPIRPLSNQLRAKRIIILSLIMISIITPEEWVDFSISPEESFSLYFSEVQMAAKPNYAQKIIIVVKLIKARNIFNCTFTRSKRKTDSAPCYRSNRFTNICSDHASYMFICPMPNSMNQNHDCRQTHLLNR